MYNVRKDVPRSKELAVADWNTSTAVGLRFLESKIRRNHYVQNTHSCSKNVVIGKQPLRRSKYFKSKHCSVKISSVVDTYKSLRAKYAKGTKLLRNKETKEIFSSYCYALKDIKKISLF